MTPPARNLRTADGGATGGGLSTGPQLSHGGRRVQPKAGRIHGATATAALRERATTRAAAEPPTATATIDTRQWHAVQAPADRRILYAQHCTARYVYTICANTQ